MNIRNLTNSILTKFLSTSLMNKQVTKKLLLLIKIMTQFLKNNPNIIFTKADKGNIIIALDKNTLKKTNAWRS